MIFRCHIQLSGESDLVIGITSQAMDFINNIFEERKREKKARKDAKKAEKASRVL